MIKELFFNQYFMWSVLTHMFQVSLLSTINLKVSVLSFSLHQILGIAPNGSTLREPCCCFSHSGGDVWERRPAANPQPGFPTQRLDVSGSTDPRKEWLQDYFVNCRALLWDELCRLVVASGNAYVGHLLNEQKNVVSRASSICAEGRL